MTTMTGKHTEWMSINEVALYLDVSIATVHRYMRTGKLTRYKNRSSTRVRILRSEVVAFNTPRKADDR